MELIEKDFRYAKKRIYNPLMSKEQLKAMQKVYYEYRNCKGKTIDIYMQKMYTINTKMYDKRFYVYKKTKNTT